MMGEAEGLAKKKKKKTNMGKQQDGLFTTAPRHTRVLRAIYILRTGVDTA